MADEQNPSRSHPLPTDVTPAGIKVPGGAGGTAITDAPKAPGREPEQGVRAAAPPLHIPWSSRLLNLGAQFAFGLLLAVFLLVVLWSTGMSPRVAGGTAV